MTSPSTDRRRRWPWLLLAGATLVLLWAWPRVVMPEVELPAGLIPADGTFNVRILRDTWGVPHILGRRDVDVAYGLAWAHAEDDFKTIQDTLLASRGKLGRVYGPDLAPNDYMVQLLRLPQVVEEGYPNLDAATRALVEGYAAGLNHFAATHPDEAYGFLYPVRGQDLVAGFVHKVPLFFGLDTALTDLFSDERQQPVSGRREARAASAAFPWMKGSNTLAVAPSRTADGSTFLAINSHQPWTGPVAWYEAHLKSEEGWDMVGGVFPGAPVILHGHNRHLGWAHTVNRPDLLDVYVLETDDQGRYRLDDQWLPLETGQAQIEVRVLDHFRWWAKRPIFHSLHGPVVQQPHGTYGIRFSGYGNVGHLQQWYRMNKARNFTQWQSAMAELSIPMFNTGYADRDGNIHYLYNARLPRRRAGWDYSAYLPGETSETLWDETKPWAMADLPQVTNPPCGYLMNANNTPFIATCPESNPQADGVAATAGIETHMTNRGLRLASLLAADDNITWDDFLRIKFDTAYAEGSTMAQLVQRALGLAADDLQPAQQVLAAWNLDTNIDNPQVALAVLAFGEYMLPQAEPPDDVTLESDLRRAVGILEQHHGGLEVPWGEVNRLRRGDVDLAVGGAPDTAHAVYGELDESKGQMVGQAGDSYILMVSWDADGNVHSESMHPFGSATADPDSPHYADQAPLFVRRQLKPVWMDEAEIRQHLEREYRPGDGG